jgi:hypothetical protein
MRSFSTVFLALSLLFVISCNNPWIIKSHDENEVDPWLNTISGGKPPEIDITGKWHDAQGGGFFSWGEGYLRQEQSKISGAIGGYSVKGVVSGKIVYLAFSSLGTVYYTARLELLQDVLIGNYFNGFDKTQTKGYSMSLEKTLGATK